LRPSSSASSPPGRRVEFTSIGWLDKELFLAPPQGEKRQLDLVARLHLRPGAPPPRTGATDLVALVHVELESRASASALRPRMFEYYVQLRHDTGLPVLPIGLLGESRAHSAFSVAQPGADLTCSSPSLKTGMPARSSAVRAA
jgi:hypothetical protein